MKSVARVACGSESGVRIEPHDYGRRIVFDAVDAWGSPVTGLSLTAQVYPMPRDQDWRAHPHPLAEESPGRYSAPMTTPPKPMIVRIVDDRGRRVATRTWEWEETVELTAAERLRRAEALAKAGGGRLNPEAATLFDATPRAIARPASIQPAMLVLALVCFLLDLAVRRFTAVAQFFGREARERAFPKIPPA